MRIEAVFARWIVDTEYASCESPRRATTARITGVITSTAASRLRAAVANDIATKVAMRSAFSPSPARAIRHPA
jgi:hypothetical protein